MSIIDEDKEKKGILTEPVIKIIKDKNFAFLGTIMKDGRPQVSPIWIDIDDNNNILLFNTAQGRIKHKNISRDPRVSLSLVDKNNPYSMVTIQGTIIEQTTIGADEHIDKLAKKYLNIDRYPSHSPSMTRVICKIKPEKMYYLPPRYTEFIGKS
ncbi:MAG TPA: PPOX class F420-dependent oxidoreductase [Nitrososphaeraceae archaeon]|jgi:PPOX class probable F420-dependent enzyme|nr:PPOX class F420-dependent oxidoreductase [Nitrososphaeraceae archaeon]HSL13396.1 PPOX class F420-dependent oxidoreductase [Nitrososphaeraceae archaeon]